MTVYADEAFLLNGAVDYLLLICAAITNRINYAELPETGGRGTGIFYVLGAFLTMAGTALLLLQKRCSFCRMTRRRQETESKYDYHK